MLEVLKALGFIGLGVVLSESYNRRIWKKYREGRRDQAEYQPRYYSWHRKGMPR